MTKQTKKKQKVKTPITYYGGKQTLAGRIIPLMPEHTTYNEPFFGGGAIFFSKPPSACEIINDRRDDVVNFYRICSAEFSALRTLIIGTVNSRSVHREAAHILKNPEPYSSLKRAWAFWVQTNMSFASVMFGGWAFEKKTHKTGLRLHNKRVNFTKHIYNRLKLVQVENRDALEVIKLYDSPETFHYCDPPYFNANMGHYGGYTAQDFKNLLETLSSIKGKFLLSSYPSQILEEYAKQFGWKQIQIVKGLSVGPKTGQMKTEVLTANYII
jgi:DNA adenine methylase